MSHSESTFAHLPFLMTVDELALENFRSFEKFHISFQPGLNVITGVNGVGKTSILEAIHLGMSHMIARLKSENGNGKSIEDSSIKNETEHACVRLRFSTREVEPPQQENEQEVKKTENVRRFYSLSLAATRAGLNRGIASNYKEVAQWAQRYRSARSEGKPVHYPLLAYYKVTRAVLDIPKRVRGKEEGGQLAGYNDAISGGGNFRSFFAWFREQEDRENEERLSREDIGYRDPGLEVVREAIKAFMPALSDIKVRRKHMALVAKKNGVEVELSQLSDGEKCYLALIGDISCRLARLSEGLNLSTKKVLDSPGIVLIDELDLHMHPRWQREVINLLPKTFKNIQFIITTHSPQMIGETDARRVRCLVQGEEEALSPDNTKGLSSSEILRIIMETRERDEVSERLVASFHDAIDKNDFQQAEDILKKLKEETTNSSKLPLIQELSAELSFLRND